MAVRAPESVAEEFVEALAAQDWQRLAGCFAPDAMFRAAVPNIENPFRQRDGADDTAAQFAAWFGDGDPLELESHQVDTVQDRIRVAYRFRSFEDGRWHLVEQQAYCRIGERGIEQMQLTCSGLRPLA